MQIFFKPSFVSDFKKLPPDVQKEIRHVCVEIFPKLKSVRDFSLHNIKPIAGFKLYFRIKINNHRIGFKQTGNIVEFMRVKHRKDIYRYFP